MRLVQYLEDIKPEDVETYGGKAVNLAKLIELGFQVPRGFCISSESFDRMVSKNQSLGSFLRKVDKSDDFEEILEISRDIQKMISTYEIPENLVKDLSKHLKHLEKTEYGFAVRSSATIEDRNDISFAGQAKSFLCVKNQVGLVESVRKVWQSAFSDRALIYLKTKNIPLTQVKMAVIIQEMIPAKISGVMFTANVVTNNTEEILINSTWELGDLLVSGEIVPDTYILTKSPLRVTHKKLGEKEFTSDPNLYGLAIVDTPKEKSSVFSLDDETLFDIAEIGMKIESGMESPQDIEWCIRPDGGLAILQARPITTLNAPSSHEVKSQE
ncbi:MAG: PEP/pyruvate-binding domain-containing protein [Candidatus Thorarchaeota archaeon]